MSIAVERCLRYRRRILEISQQVTALHIAPAFSCVEIVDAIYNVLMRKEAHKRAFKDVFIMSKGHGCMIQYVILEELGILTKQDLDLYCKPTGRLGAHPDFGVPGIAASTGSLGHGLSIAVGQAYAEKIKGTDVRVYCVVSDGELQEGSSWEAIMMAANLQLSNLFVFVDNNDFGGLARMSEHHKAFYPLAKKFWAFGWDGWIIDGHDSMEFAHLTHYTPHLKPTAITCRTVKGKGVSFMEDEPIWHYRSPNPKEFKQAMRELEDADKRGSQKIV